jgi:hypothetical protein
MLTILNRDGEPNVNIGLNFIGPCGTFRELPRAGEMNTQIEQAATTYSNGKAAYIRNSSGVWVPNPNI